MSTWPVLALAALMVHACLAQVIVDLSAPLAEAGNMNANPGATALHRTRSRDIFGFAVVKKGALVAAAPETATRNVYSVTKTFVATMIGQLVQQGRLSVTTTLEVALPGVNWAQVEGASDKKAITIGQMLSMTSGLRNFCVWPGPQDTIEATLNSPKFVSDQVGRHFYLCSCAILSYVIHRQTGKTPLQFAEDEFFPALGITRSVAWQPTHGSDGIQATGHGLVLGPLELAKLGQLYRQGGVTDTSMTTQLLPAAFVVASSADQLEQRIPSSALDFLGSACKFKSAGAGYGYMKWIFSTSSGPVDCAVGHGGQFICSWPDLDVIIAVTSSDDTDYTSSCQLLDLVASGLDFDGNDTSSGGWATDQTASPVASRAPLTSLLLASASFIVNGILQAS